MSKAFGLLFCVFLASCASSPDPSDAPTVLPNVVVTAPENGATVRDPTVRVQGTINDVVTRLAFAVNSGARSELPYSEGTFDTTVDVTAGDNTLLITAANKGGAEASAQIALTYTPTSQPAPRPPTGPEATCNGLTPTIVSETGGLVEGTAGDDVILLLAPGSVDANAGDDVICGSSGDDILDAGSGNDTVLAGAGDDTLDGGAGDDALSGDAGDDMIDGGAGMNVLDGGEGFDICDGGSTFESCEVAD